MARRPEVEVKLHDILTDHNSDGDIVSILGVVAFVFFIGFTVYTVYTVYKNHTFDPLTYSAGAAALLAGIGGGYRLKSGQTPPPSP